MRQYIFIIILLKIIGVLCWIIYMKDQGFTEEELLDDLILMFLDTIEFIIDLLTLILAIIYTILSPIVDSINPIINPIIDLLYNPHYWKIKKFVFEADDILPELILEGKEVTSELVHMIKFMKVIFIQHEMDWATHLNAIIQYTDELSCHQDYQYYTNEMDSMGMSDEIIKIRKYIHGDNRVENYVGGIFKERDIDTLRNLLKELNEPLTKKPNDKD
jgi:glycosyltransferase involved in cell wall biosynthesis